VLNTPRGAFDSAARGLASKWVFKDGWVMMRSDNWEYSRAITVPAHEVFEIRDRLVADQGSFDAMSYAALRLTDRQTLDSLISAVFARIGRWQANDRDLRRFSLMRFWGSEPIEVRKRFLAGETFAFGSLPPDSRRFLTEFAYRQDDRPYEASINSYGKEAEIERTDVDWMKQNWPGYPTEYDIDDNEPTQLLPDGIPPSALVGVHASQGHALVVSNDKGWAMAMTEQMAIGSGSYPGPEGENFLARPAVDLRMFFTIAFAPKLAFGIQFSSIRAVAGTEPKKYSELPADIKTRLEAGAVARHGG
jgi:hypothetical protein